MTSDRVLNIALRALRTFGLAMFATDSCIVSETQHMPWWQWLGIPRQRRRPALGGVVEAHMTFTEQQELPMSAERAVQTVAESHVVAASADTIMAVISRAASDPNTDVEKLERLTGLYERITAQNAKAAYTTALAEMQPELPVIVQRGEIRHGENKPVQSTYAKWEDINEAIRPVLHRHGFALSFRTGQDGQLVKVTAVLSHREGHSEETTLALPIDASGSKNNVQGVGSSTSYGKRYTACALLNITTRGEDDDAISGGAGGQSAASEAATAAINACNTLDELKAWKTKNADNLVRLGSEADPIIRLFNQRVQNLKGAKP